MTREETIKILAVLKSNYSEQLKTLKPTDAEGMVNGWQAQFNSVPYSVMSIAVNRYSAKSPYFPKYCDIYDELRGLKAEAETMMYRHDLATKGVVDCFEHKTILIGTPLDEFTLAQVKLILTACSPQNTEEKPLEKLISETKQIMEISENATQSLKIEGRK